MIAEAMTAFWLAYMTAALLALGLSAFFSGAETGIYCVNRVRLHVANDRDDRGARRLWRFLADEQSALCVTLAGTNIANYALTAVVAMFIGRELGLDERGQELYTTVAVTPVIFAFGEVVPKNVFRVAADRLMYPAARVLNGAHGLFLPLLWGTRFVAARLSGLLGSAEAAGDAPFAARRRMTGVLREGLIHAGREPEQFDLIERVLTLSSIPIHSVMVPRNRVVSVRADAGLRGLRALARRNRHTRLPVYERDPRRIIGAVVVHEALAKPVGDDLHPVVKPVLTLAPRDTVASAIVRMQKEHQTMGIVVDRSGLLLGLVTLKDLMEQIVGELAEW
ncbi:MAG: DUF21 domain-containing protein [Phycisphaerales bacterium]|nr:MAG: DUF21 domain-containing protein [Phycisphaerales bacterium]